MHFGGWGLELDLVLDYPSGLNAFKVIDSFLYMEQEPDLWTFFSFISFFLFLFSVPTSEALLPRRSSRHPHLRGPTPRGPQEETSDRW